VGKIFELTASLGRRVDLQIVGVGSKQGATNEVATDRIDVWDGECYARWCQGLSWGVPCESIVRDEYNSATSRREVYPQFQ